MKPIELNSKTLSLPNDESKNIIIITGSQNRHKRFALKIQKEFPNNVVAWYQINSKISAKQNNLKRSIKKTNGNHIVNAYSSLKNVFRKINKHYRKYGYKATKYYLMSKLNSSQRLNKYRNRKKNFLYYELAWLQSSKNLEPIKINRNQLNTYSFRDELKSKDPFFLLILGGPLYKDFITKVPRGITINQHAGHSPEYKGGNTTHWAIYHRDILKISNTIHIATTGADSGAIIRRSNPCIFPEDNEDTIFERTVILGTELLIEVVKDLMNGNSISIFSQPKFSGNTYRYHDYDEIRPYSRYDIKKGWLNKELNRLRKF